jgi:hypothetical protein
MPLPATHERFRLYEAETGVQLGEFTGAELKEKGITVHIPEQYQAKVPGIERI